MGIRTGIELMTIYYFCDVGGGGMMREYDRLTAKAAVYDAAAAFWLVSQPNLFEYALCGSYPPVRLAAWVAFWKTPQGTGFWWGLDKLVSEERPYMRSNKIVSGVSDADIFTGPDVSFDRVRERISKHAPFIGQMVANTRFHMHAGFSDKLYRVYVDVGGRYPGQGDSFFYVIYDTEIQEWFLADELPALAVPYLPGNVADFAEWLQVDPAKVHLTDVRGFFKLLRSGSYVQFVSNSLIGK